MRFKDAVLDAAPEAFEYFRELVASLVVWNIVRDDVEHRIDLRCFFRFRFVEFDGQFLYVEFTLGYQACGSFVKKKLLENRFGMSYYVRLVGTGNNALRIWASTPQNCPTTSQDAFAETDTLKQRTYTNRLGS